MVRDINFSLYEGEIVGFAGLMGAGRTETTRVIFGADHKDSGEIEHKIFRDITEYLKKGDCLVINDTKVLPARLIGERKNTGVF